jgi:hypothetical protein
MISLADVSGKSGVISAGRLQREWGVLARCRLAVLASSMSLMGHKRPSHPAPVPINVRCAPNSDRNLRRSEMSLSANKLYARFDKMNDVAETCGD